MSNFNVNAIKMIDQSTVETEGPRYPTISFISGDITQKKAGGVGYEGGWFIGEDGAPADMTNYGWEKDSIMTHSGKEIEGYWARKIEIAVINHRRRWTVEGESFPWSQYEEAAKKGNPRGHQQFLVLIKGAEELGPFSVTLKGHAGMSFQGARQYASSGCLSVFNKTVIAAANAKTKPAKWPYRAFWLAVGAAKNGKGEPVFTEVGSGNATSKIVLPVPVGLPEKAGEVDLSNFYVGDDLLAVANQLNVESADWVAQWDNVQATSKPDASEEEPVNNEASADELGL